MSVVVVYREGRDWLIQAVYVNKWMGFEAVLDLRASGDKAGAVSEDEWERKCLHPAHKLKFLKIPDKLKLEFKRRKLPVVPSPKPELEPELKPFSWEDSFDGL